MKSYYEEDRLSQSLLKRVGDYYEYLEYIKSNEKEEIKRLKINNALVIGNAVDCLLTRREDWDYLIIEDVPKPQDLFFIENLLELCKGEPYTVEQFVQAYLDSNIKSRSIDKFQEHFETNLLNTFNMMNENYNNNWITRADYDLVMDITNNILSHEYTKDIFEWKDESYNQLVILFDYEGVPCKAMLDRVNIDHKNKLIKPYDIKTTRHTPRNFNKAIDDNRYDIQARWYTIALEFYFADLIADGYVVDDFKFVVGSKVDPKCPIQVTLKFENQERLDQEIKDKMEKYKYYREHGLTLDQEIALNKGNLVVTKYY